MNTTPSPNFAYLAHHDARLVALATQADIVPFARPFMLVVVVALSLAGCRGCKKDPAVRLTYAVDVGAAFDDEKDAAKVMEEARATVARRIDDILGARFATVTTKANELIVELAALDPAALRDMETIIGQSGRLEFAMVDDSTNFFGNVRDEDLPEGEGIAIYAERAPNGVGADGRPVATTTDYARMALQPPKHANETLEQCRQRFQVWTQTLSVPDDHRVGFEPVTSFDRDTNKSTDEGWRTLYLFRRVELSNRAITDVSAEQDQSGGGGYYVALTLDAAGATKFEALTAANVERRLAIVVDGVVESAPVIKSKIPGGHVSITMGAGEPEQQLAAARKLELVLRSGALPAPMVLEREEKLGSGAR